MLGKLLKHDFLSTAKVMIPLNLVLLISTFFGCIFLGTKLWHREEFFFLFILLFFAYVIMISSVLYITLIYLTVHYYRNMFSSQGYLTFTLPVSSWTLLNSRFLTGFFWYLITGFFTVFSVTALVISVLGFSNVFSFLKDIIVTKTIDIDGFIYEISDVTQQMFGYTIPQLIFLILLLVLISSFASVSSSSAKSIPACNCSGV